MSFNRQQLLSSAGLFSSGLFILVLTFQMLHGSVMAQEIEPGAPETSNFTLSAWGDSRLPTSPLYVAQRGFERLEMTLLEEKNRPEECLDRSLDRLETARYSWHQGFYGPTMMTLHKGFVYLHEAAHGWSQENYSALTPVADAYEETLTQMSQNGFSESQKSEILGLREHVQIIRTQFHF